MRRIYGETADQGAAGPWLEREDRGEGEPDRSSPELPVQTDKLWSRQLMLERARQVFLSVYLGQGVGRCCTGGLSRSLPGSCEEP